MKRNIMVVVLVGAMAPPLAIAESSGSSGKCFSNRIDAMQKMVNGATEVFDDTIKSPDLDSVDKCLGAIKKPRFDFGMSFPSIDDILSEICSIVKSKIDQTISGLDYSFDMDGFGNGYGSGINTYEFPVSEFEQKEPSYSTASSDSVVDTGERETDAGGYTNRAIDSAIKYLVGGN
jgi:hypothetical protein